MPLLAYVGTFSEQLHFRETYFFTVSTSEQLVLQSNQFDKTVTFAEQLCFQRCYFFGTPTFSDLSLLLSSFFVFFQNTSLFKAQLLLSSYLFRIDNSLGQLLGIILFRNKDRRTTFSKQVLLYSTKFLRTATFSTKLILQKRHLLR